MFLFLVSFLFFLHKNKIKQKGTKVNVINLGKASSYWERGVTVDSREKIRDLEEIVTLLQQVPRLLMLLQVQKERRGEERERRESEEYLAHTTSR